MANNETMAVSLPSSLAGRTREHAAKEERSVSFVVRAALESFLPKPAAKRGKTIRKP